MRQYKTQGIIIRRTNFSETDRLLTIYTRDFGKVQAIAKGVRKTSSKLSGHVELFYLTQFEIHKGRNIDIVTGANLIEKYDNLRKNNDLVNHTHYMSELVYRSTQEDLAHKELFYLIRDIFKSIDDKNKEKLVCYFELKLFDILGHAPEVSKCVVCGSKISNGKNYFDYLCGGVVCEKCLKNKENALEIDGNLIKLLRIIEKQNNNYFERIKTNQSIINALRSCISQIRHSVLEKELKSSRFL